jgi:hypothetical protein
LKLKEKIKCPECYGPCNEYCYTPEQLDPKAAIGMFHCPGCGVMQLAGLPHISCSTCGGKGYIERYKEK